MLKDDHIPVKELGCLKITNWMFPGGQNQLRLGFCLIWSVSRLWAPGTYSGHDCPDRNQNAILTHVELPEPYHKPESGSGGMSQN